MIGNHWFLKKIHFRFMTEGVLNHKKQKLFISKINAKYTCLVSQQLQLKILNKIT